MSLPSPRRFLPVLLVAATVGLAPSAPAAAATPVAFNSVVPAPASATATAGVTYPVTAATTIYTQPGSTAAAGIGGYLAATPRPPTRYPLPAAAAPPATPAHGMP